MSFGATRLKPRRAKRTQRAVSPQPKPTSAPTPADSRAVRNEPKAGDRPRPLGQPHALNRPDETNPNSRAPHGRAHPTNPTSQQPESIFLALRSPNEPNAADPLTRVCLAAPNEPIRPGCTRGNMTHRAGHLLSQEGIRWPGVDLAHGGSTPDPGGWPSLPPRRRRRRVRSDRRSAAPPPTPPH